MKVTIYEKSAELPPLTDHHFFHSRELMELCEQTPGQRPYMAVVTDEEQQVVAHLLAIQYQRHLWLPPFIYRQVRILGEGSYDNAPDQAVFTLMLDALTQRLQHRALFIEFSHFSQKMFGYQPLREAGYFPVRWMSVHNSLHSRTPEERIMPRLLQRIRHAEQRGVTVKAIESDEEFDAFFKLLHRHNMFKPRRYLPDKTLFRRMVALGKCRMLITCYIGKIIGGSISVHSDGDAYLWYSASLRKSYAMLHPNAVTYWHTILDAHQTGMRHIRFMDVGLPFRKNPYRDFILRFGGKETSTYRWFRISIGWMNKLASWLWRT